MQVVKVLRGKRLRYYAVAECCLCSKELLMDQFKFKLKVNHFCKICSVKKNQLKRWQSHTPQRNTPIKNTWEHMMKRCYSPTHKKYHRYGGRGIEVTKEWHDYETFKKWAEQSWFAGATIDRIDNDGNYEPNNCQWLTASENSLKRWRC